eukprot:5205126-Amphidinium_carterae.1
MFCSELTSLGGLDLRARTACFICTHLERVRSLTPKWMVQPSHEGLFLNSLDSCCLAGGKSVDTRQSRCKDS